MKKKTTTSSRAAGAGLISPIPKRVDPASFRDELKPAALRKLTGIRTIPPFLFQVESLSPIRTIGLGRTNITCVGCNTFQTDATPAHAFFDASTSTRDPAVQMHFDPAAYGFGTGSSLIMSFSISVFGGSAVFAKSGLFVTNPGNITVSGNVRISLVFNSTGPMFGLLSQVSGSTWQWLSTQVSFIPILTPL